jgi:hypothetical protein
MAWPSLFSSSGEKILEDLCMAQDEILEIQKALDDYDWSVLGDLEDPKPDYNNSCSLDVHLYSVDKRVDVTARYLCSEIDYTSNRAVTHMKVVLLNLYWNYRLCEERWVGYSRDNNRYGIPFKYNVQRIEVHPLIKVVDGLERLGYIDPVRFHFNGVPGEGRCTRMKATAKLIDLLEDKYGFTIDVVGRHPNEEVILLRDENKKPYWKDDNAQVIRMRKFLNQYNEFIQQTYIDLDYVGYTRIKVLRNNSPEYRAKLPNNLFIDMTKKKMRRVFNNKSYIEGGRFYGAYWMEMPSKLRLRLIFDKQKVIEADYSGIHIHLLYNKIGIDYGIKKEDPYAIPGYPTTDKYRNLFKKLLLAAVNAQDDDKSTGENKAIKALRKSINFNPDDYPDEIPDLHKVISDFKKHHTPIANFLFTGVGYELMYTDSQIAECVMKEMYKHSIPVLPVHDSFICPKQYSEHLVSAMTNAYRTITGKKLTVTPYTVNIKTPDEWDMTGDERNPEQNDGDFYFDLTLSQNDKLIQHMIQLEGDDLFDDEVDDSIDVFDKSVTPHELYVTIPITYIKKISPIIVPLKVNIAL